MFQSKKESNTTTIVQSVRVISQIIFSGTLIIYLFLLILENLWAGFVSYTFNPDLLLIPIVLSGIFLVTIPSKITVSKHITDKLKAFDIVLVIFFSIIGFFVVYYKMNSLGITAWVLSIAASIIILILGIIMLIPEKGEQQNIE